MPLIECTLLIMLSLQYCYHYQIFVGAMNTTVPCLLHVGSRRVGTFAHYLRIPEPLIDKLVGKVAPHIQKIDTRMRRVIDVWNRLACTLRHLAKVKQTYIMSFD